MIIDMNSPAALAQELAEARQLIGQLIAALEMIEYQSKTVAGLRTCGEREFLNGLATIARKAITPAVMTINTTKMADTP